MRSADTLSSRYSAVPKDGAAAIKAVEQLYDLAPALLALARRLPVEDAELIHRVIEALPFPSVSR